MNKGPGEEDRVASDRGMCYSPCLQGQIQLSKKGSPACGVFNETMMSLYQLEEMSSQEASTSMGHQ